VVRCARPFLWDEGIARLYVSRTYLRGEGIEIGALHNPLPLPETAHVRYVDRCSVEDLRKHYAELREAPLVHVDVIDDGERLSQFGDGSLDFVIANHFLEHCQDPIRAVSNMLRVLKANGILYLALPDKRHTFDAGRPVTPLEHLWRDYDEGSQWSKRQHFEEWVRCVEKPSSEAQFSETVERLISTDYSIHFHVWTQTEMFELLLSMRSRLKLSLDFELALKSGHECIFAIRKMA
jgi:SAM-dependent methyltransferase